MSISFYLSSLIEGKGFHTAKKNCPEKTGGPASKPLVHLIDGFKGVPLGNRQPIYFRDGKRVFNCIFNRALR